MQKIDKMYAAFTGQSIEKVQQYTERDRFLSVSEVMFSWHLCSTICDVKFLENFKSYYKLGVRNWREISQKNWGKKSSSIKDLNLLMQYEASYFFIQPHKPILLIVYTSDNSIILILVVLLL